MNRFAVLLFPGFLVLFGSGSAQASVVTGTVYQSGSVPVPGVNVDFIDRATGINIPITSGDTTNTTGDFTVDIPDGSYDVTYTPPTGSGLAGFRQNNRTVLGATSLGPVTLPPGYAVTLRTVDVSGAPQASIVARFKDSLAQDVFAPGNTSTVTGAISTAVPQTGGPYSITLRDESGSGFADKTFINFQPTLDTALGDVIVGPAQPLAGRTVRYSDSTPVAGVNVDVFDACGLEVEIHSDLTDASGDFSLTGISDGRYEVILRPPFATGLDRKTLLDVAVSGPLALGNIPLGSLRIVSGRVLNASLVPLPNVDLDFHDQAIGQLVLANNDNTIANGSFASEVTDGVYTIDFRPRFDLTVAPLTMFDMTINANRNLGDIILGNALFLSGNVTDARGTPVPGANLDVFDPGRGLKVYTPEDTSDGAGHYASRFAAGTWNLVFTPPASRADLGSATFSGYSISSNQVLDVVLPSLLSAIETWTLYR